MCIRSDLKPLFETDISDSSYCDNVDENSGVDRNSVKLVDESSVVVQNTGLKLEGLDEKAVVDQRVFSPLLTYRPPTGGLNDLENDWRKKLLIHS